MLPLGAAGPGPKALALRPDRPQAALPLLGRPGTGRVVWAREGAAWLRLPDGIIGLAPPGAPLGPRWVRRAEPWPDLAEGDPVLVDDGLRTADGTRFLDGRQAVGWLGPLPNYTALTPAPARTVISGSLAQCRASVLLEQPWSATVEPAVDSIGRLPPLEALHIVARALGGLGPGLTPAGDDALSGILFAFRAMGGPSVEPGLLTVVRSVHTSDLGGTVLQAAAAGFHIEPVHDLVMAAVAGDRGAAKDAVAELDRYGSSSGADLAYGLRLAFTRH